MKSDINITINNDRVLTIKVNSTINDVVNQLPIEESNQIIGAKINNEIVDFDMKLRRDTKINFFDVNDLAGYKMYQAGLKFVLQAALNDVYHDDFEVNFNHSIMRGIHVSVKGKRNFTKEDCIKIRQRMSYIIDEDIRIIKMNISSKEVYQYYIKNSLYEKACNIHNILDNVLRLYKLENVINYFYVEMPYSTRVLSKFDLVYLNDNELCLMFPNPRSSMRVPEYVHYDKVIKCFKEEKEFLNKKYIPYVYNINDYVARGKITDIIRMAEVSYDNHIHDIVNKAVLENKKFIMVAGPSSSGKTTSTKKMALCLEAMGYHTVLLSTDDYFKERVDSPKNPDGSYNFECLECIDIELLNKQLKALLNGEEIDIPSFNFYTGKKEYNDNKMSLKDNGIVLIEGLHCLNSQLTYDIDDKDKLKVYLSPFMPLSIDRHNYISTVDLRLIRRIIRDNRNRGYDVNDTIDSWQKVRDGEEKNIFPFIHQADVILNTALVYELGVLKVYAEPLLYSVTNESKYYEEARRLITFLKNYFPISSEYVSENSVIREFIGGSIFE